MNTSCTHSPANRRLPSSFNASAIAFTSGVGAAVEALLVDSMLVSLRASLISLAATGTTDISQHKLPLLRLLGVKYGESSVLRLFESAGRALDPTLGHPRAQQQRVVRFLRQRSLSTAFGLCEYQSEAAACSRYCMRDRSRGRLSPDCAARPVTVVLRSYRCAIAAAPSAARAPSHFALKVVNTAIKMGA